MLLEARAGSVPVAAPDVLPSLCTALPLPWSVELAARAAAAGAPWGPDLAVRLTDLLGDGVAGEIGRRRDDPDRTVRRGAAAVLRAIPARPPATVGIRVLGPLEVDHDAHPVDTPELHRTRVRELLSVLVVERTVSRDRVIDLLWPDLDPTRGRANLRVTLRHLQRVLEPDRGQGSAPYFLRGDAQQLRLVSVPGSTSTAGRSRTSSPGPRPPADGTTRRPGSPISVPRSGSGEAGVPWPTSNASPSSATSPVISKPGSSTPP